MPVRCGVLISFAYTLDPDLVPGIATTPSALRLPTADGYPPGLLLGGLHWGHVPCLPVFGLVGSTRWVTSIRSGSSDAM